MREGRKCQHSCKARWARAWPCDPLVIFWCSIPTASMAACLRGARWAPSQPEDKLQGHLALHTYEAEAEYGQPRGCWSKSRSARCLPGPAVHLPVGSHAFTGNVVLSFSDAFHAVSQTALLEVVLVLLPQSKRHKCLKMW